MGIEICENDIRCKFVIFFIFHEINIVIYINDFLWLKK